jgi:hypothetical protein
MSHDILCHVIFILVVYVTRQDQSVFYTLVFTNQLDISESAIIWHQIQRVAFMHKPDWPRDISA